ncbi:MAG: energy transducer TonB, partial [Bacillota bacterium]
MLVFVVLWVTGLPCSFPSGGGPEGGVAGAFRFCAGPAPAYAADPQMITLDVREADLRDVLSALALKMGSTIILGIKEDKPVKVTFQVQNVTPAKALELLVQKQGLAYLQKENLIVVGEPEKLKENFFNEMILTRFDTYYLPAGKVKELIGELAIPLQTITVETNLNAIWVQGTAQALQKVRELINAVDLPENLPGLEYRIIAPTQISPTRAVELLTRAGISLQHYVEM